MNMIEIMKQAAMEAMDASQPTAVIEGTVVSAKPLKIQVSQMEPLTKDFLVLCQAVTDYEVEITVDWETDNHTHTHSISDTYTGGGSAGNNTHKHAVKGKKKITVHQALKKGDKVLMIRQSGGQRFYVVGRL